MKTLLQGTSFFLLFLCLLFTQCSKTPDTPVKPKSSTKTLASPTIDGVTGASITFDAATSTYTVTVPSGTDVTALKVSFTLPTGATSKPTVGSAQNFTNPVVYTVTAEDGTTQAYTVKVVVTAVPKSAEKQITAFTFADLSPVVSATIDQPTRKIAATIPAIADLTSLVPTLTISAKATVLPASGVVQNFTNPVNYTITAEDGSKQIYEVKVEKTAVVNSTVACLCTRIEDVADANEYVAFEYDANGRVAKITATKKFSQIPSSSFDYNQNGEVTKLLLPAGNSQELSYTNGKLTSYKLYKNGVLLTGTVNGPNGEYIGDFALNENNEVIKYKSDKYEYTNGNLTKIEFYDGSKKNGEFKMEYDVRSHYLSASKPKGIFGFLYSSIAIGGDYGIIIGITTTFLNNPTKLISADGVSINYNYTYNNKGLPTQVELTSTSSNGSVKLKYIYSNCQ